MDKEALRIWPFENAPLNYKVYNKIAEPADAMYLIVVPPNLITAFDDLMMDALYTGYVEPDHYTIDGEHIYVTYE